MKFDFSSYRVLIIGDVILDEYKIGQVERLSPENPIPVLSDCKLEYRLGGAANVAHNMKTLGAKSQLLSVIGLDQNGQILKELLEEKRIKAELIKDDSRITTCKTRYFDDGKPLIRVDYEDDKNLSQEINAKLIQALELLLNGELYDLIVLQDYNKGCLNKDNIENIIQIAKERNIKIVVDPKVKNFNLYKNADLIKPNLNEFRSWISKEGDHIDFDEEVNQLNKELNINNWFITLSDQGIFAKKNKISFRVPTASIEDVDVCGAGDSVICILGLLLLENLLINEMAGIANKVGGLACKSFGTSVVSIEQLNQSMNA